jgi:hypothetical protein
MRQFLCLWLLQALFFQDQVLQEQPLRQLLLELELIL